MAGLLHARNAITGSFFFLVTQLSEVLLFALLYMLLEWSEPGVNFDNIKCEKGEFWCSSYVKFFYFSLCIQSTIGYGDIVPKTEKARLLNIIQIFSLIYLISETIK